MTCERCGKGTEGFGLHDYCAECGKNLCEDCMAGGCCGFVPARSGMDGDGLNDDDDERAS